MRINHNMVGIFASRTLSLREKSISSSIEKLASGERINRAGDDASGLAVSEKLRSQIRGLMQAARNAQDGISFLQVAEGSLQEVHSILHRVRELAIQAANGIYSQSDRELIQIEVSQLVNEIDRIAKTAEFNKMKILDGSQKEIQLQVGANANQTIKFSIGTMTTNALKVDKVSISSVAQANQSLGSVDNAVDTLSKQRAVIGAVENRLDHTLKNLMVSYENLQAAESQIRDTDIASEIVEFTRQEILLQTNTAMLAQANLLPRTVLQLLA